MATLAVKRIYPSLGMDNFDCVMDILGLKYALKSKTVSKLPAVSTQVSEARYCFLEQRVSASRKLRVSCVGREQCHPDYRVARKRFAGYGIEFVASGQGEAVLNGKAWPLRPGALFCYGPRTSHVITTDNGKPMAKYFVDFFGIAAAQIFRRSRLRPGNAVYTLELESFEAVFEAMLTEGNKGLPSSPEICSSYLQILLLRSGEAISSQSGRQSPAASNFQRCKTCIDAQFASLRDLNDIARASHITPAYLCRLFQRFGQASPFQYLTRRKLNRAAELLAGEGCAVKEAAATVGYPDPYHFSRVFRSFFGISPAAFAKNHRT